MAGDPMRGFGYKTGWLSIRDGNLDEVVTALGGEVAGPVTWTHGVRAAYDGADTVLVTPPLPGAGGDSWMLVAGEYIGSTYPSLDLAELSAGLGREVQLFVTHRVVDLHRWERAVDGARVRSFAYVAGTGWESSGEPTPVELAIGIPSTPSTRAASDQSLRIREDDVMRVAGAWSVDPTSLDGEPAAGPLILVRFPGTARRPEHGARVVTITDIITSSGDIDEVNRRIRARMREQGARTGRRGAGPRRWLSTLMDRLSGGRGECA